VPEYCHVAVSLGVHGLPAAPNDVTVRHAFHLAAHLVGRRVTDPSQSVDPDTIHIVAANARMGRDAGATPTVDLRTKSSAAPGRTSRSPTAVSYSRARSFFDVDPKHGFGRLRETTSSPIRQFHLAYDPARVARAVPAGLA